ncbi:Stk1 family PASTA domain-containing Ser/Thr kinase [Georgenia thermotolerans]|uniref:non-specific serine/threonine protein kinase n=1 Tax=Georgenia thermotolerans TaxID=527326 RepID=A0A7J5UK97_9MICO|nr:Stk1 family PASTA domain-containing Ser/Thr kinase [Georgenia thermotolerans]KAE8762691.1 Stk1 family PASTA domain-containing Ser/Thr kinase [Georgenia thermotolerans]
MDEIPRVLAGRYEVGELIGRGGMAEVHIGYDNRLSRTVAIKVLRSDLAKDPTFQARFRREAQSAAALNHPSIVAVYDSGEEIVTGLGNQTTTVPYIVMEYVEGHTVRSLLAGGDPVPIDEAVDIVVGVLNALEYSHHEGIVHRDIKPGNIMLTPTGAVKVMDFGIARAMTDSAATMTQTHAVVGTAQYLSPEQARGEVVDARSDLYSTGCLLYELLTGQPPFQGDSAVAVAYQHVREMPKPPSAVTPDVPESLDRVVLKALAKDRDDRYADAAHMRTDLLAAVHGGRVEAPTVAAWGAAGAAGATAVTTPLQAATATRRLGAPVPAASSPATAPPGPPEEERRKSRWWVWLLAVLAVAAAAGIAFMLLNPADKTPPPPEQVAVPAMAGMDQNAARAALSQAGLKANIVDPVPSDTVQPGLFVESDPAVGTKVDVDSTVNLAFSSGPNAVDVPNVAGMSQDQAAAALKSAGLAVGNVSEANDPSVGIGDVISTDPKAGASAAPGTAVKLTIASPNADLPDLKGKTEEEASGILRSLDLGVRIETVPSGDFPAGTVLEQSRPAGVVARGETITLQVATEAQNAPSPSPTDTGKPSDKKSDKNTDKNTDTPDTSGGDGGDTSGSPTGDFFDHQGFPLGG